MPHEMTTLSEDLENLRQAKHDNEFRMTEEGFKAVGTNQLFQPEDLTITKNYLNEGMSDPADNSVIYIIEANNGLKGYALTGYGIYTDYEDDAFDDFIAKVPVNENP
jgi:hypothetical protein